MAMKRMMIEIGMGTDIRGADYTKAAVRALRDALWHNSLTVAAAIGKPTDAMVCEIHIGVPKPHLVDKAQVPAQIGRNHAMTPDKDLPVNNKNRN